MTIKKALLFCVLSTCFASIQAGGSKETDTLTVEVHYRQGSYLLDPAYMNNQNRIDSLLELIDSLSAKGIYQMERFSVVSGASPEGSAPFNKRLSKKRTENIVKHLRGHLPTALDSLLSEKHIGVDWDNLTSKVERSDMPHREEVLHILRNTPELVIKNGVVVDSRKRQLMILHRGDCWRYMEKRFFPGMRRSWIELEYSSIPQPPVPEEPVEIDTVGTIVEIPDTLTLVPQGEILPGDSIVTPSPAAKPGPPAPFFMAIKTNLLYDALMVPNAGVEFYLGKGFSIGGNWMYAWWRNNKRHRYWRLYGGELAVRKYFGRPDGGSPLTGHHLGIYGQIFTYDFEIGGRGYMGGKPGGTLWEEMNYAAGVEYGYSLPVARRLNIDFVIGLGYWGGTYYEYLPKDKHYIWQQTKQRHWFGPTKAEVSLVWLLGRGNYNTKKGGKQ